MCTFANRVDHQTPDFAASDLDLHSLLCPFYGTLVNRLIVSCFHSNIFNSHCYSTEKSKSAFLSLLKYKYKTKSVFCLQTCII